MRHGARNEGVHGVLNTSLPGLLQHAARQDVRTLAARPLVVQRRWQWWQRRPFGSSCAAILVVLASLPLVSGTDGNRGLICGTLRQVSGNGGSRGLIRAIGGTFGLGSGTDGNASLGGGRCWWQGQVVGHVIA